MYMYNTLCLPQSEASDQYDTDNNISRPYALSGTLISNMVEKTSIQSLSLSQYPTIDS